MGVTGSFIGGLAVVTISAASPPDREPTFGPTFWATVGLIVTTVITTVGGWIWQGYKEARDRRWRIEDAKAKEGIAALAVDTKDTLVAKIDENTEMNRQALDAANNLNLKMAAAQETVAQAAEMVKKQVGGLP